MTSITSYAMQVIKHKKDWLDLCNERLTGVYCEAAYGAVTYLIPEWVLNYNVDARIYAVAKFDAADPSKITYTLPPYTTTN